MIIPESALSTIAQYQQAISVSQKLYDAYVMGLGHALGIDFEKQFFDGKAFVNRPESQEKQKEVSK